MAPTLEVWNAGKQMAQKMVAFINQSPSAFHAVEQCRKRLEECGFQRLSEKQSWVGKLQANGRYYFTRNNSSIVAFAIGGKYQPQNGFKIIGAHTDSPNLQVKPVSATGKAGYQQVSVATYGGGLWHTWFDRDLTLAGRVMLRADGKLQTRLVHIERPILKVPNLAIHLQTADERTAFKISKEDHICPILCTKIAAELAGEEGVDKPRHHAALLALLAEQLQCNPEDITDFELSVCDTQPASVGGLHNEFVFAPRIDNLASCFCALEAMATAEGLESDPQCRVIALFDHEEVGSDSYAGAGCTHITSLITRLTCDLQTGASSAQDYEVATASSTILSADGAHATHPCYVGKHHELHRPELHKGPVLKFNANQRYATTAPSAAAFRELGVRHGIPLQDFAVGNDTGCGSTIGPISATRLGIRTIDIGIGQLSMHSIRETCGTVDVLFFTKLMAAFFTDYHTLEIDE
eukprot:CAMPEP_0174382868 /NCGR_PEP_ID=MMETSP0811_2-20130205/124860_1 /TAXON_ID=73025 ORGANISM="Eutreptiella gymnastica-like, Strain CCMP1594" /NCGR_SAMPLE_ID=MMETSP0811_2 /ASSEMBLY_ACC=CAM_ASM_000667 /LENGTH=464 /DNA_ID=CAMNT_0015536275 /DNA_START=47 /DNA_END=1441 /DNA_ORIENTATION=-